jgi:hypothetical protein
MVAWDEVRTLIMSMGWMTQVASMPEAPPLTKGFTVFHAPPAATACCCLASAISAALGCGAGLGALRREEAVD